MSTSNRYSQAPQHVIATSLVLSILDLVGVSLRFIARRRKKQRIGADDYFTALATILTVGIGILLIFGVSQHALAYPVELSPNFTPDSGPLDFSYNENVMTTKVVYSYAVMLPLTLGCIKISIILFYTRIFSVSTGSKTRILLLLLGLLAGIWTIAFFLTIFLIAFKMWSAQIRMTIGIAQCASDLVLDVMLAVFPIPLVWRLHLSLRNKITATAVFLLGAVAIITSLLRLIMEAQMMIQGLDPSADKILVITEYLYWGMVECGTGIFVASLPVCQSLFRKTPWISRLMDATRTTLSSCLPRRRLYGTGSAILEQPAILLEHNPGPCPKCANKNYTLSRIHPAVEVHDGSS